MAAADPQGRIATLEMALRTSSRELHWAQLTIQKKDAVIQQLLEQLRKTLYPDFSDRPVKH